MKRFLLVVFCWLGVMGMPQASPPGVPYGGGELFVGLALLPYALYKHAKEEKQKEAQDTKRKEQYQTLLPSAHAGDAEARFKPAQATVSLEGKWKWFCQTAHQGHPDAQSRVAEFHAFGIASWTPRDPVQAYLWYSLSERQGNEKAAWRARDVREKMNPAQIAEAEQLIRQWQPDPESCKRTVTPGAAATLE